MLCLCCCCNWNSQRFIAFVYEIINILPISSKFRPKLGIWRHKRGRILKIWKFNLHNRILRIKINLNANFQRFIPFGYEIITILPISPKFWPKLGIWRHKWGWILKIWKFNLHNRIIRIKISLHANFQLFNRLRCEIRRSYCYRGII